MGMAPMMIEIEHKRNECFDGAPEHTRLANFYNFYQRKPRFFRDWVNRLMNAIGTYSFVLLYNIQTS